MKLIVAVDDRNGMMFNNRRQSRDRGLCEKILSITGGEKLWVNSYTVGLFEGYMNSRNVIVDDDFLSKAGREDFCFAENVLPAADEVDSVIIFRWNRKYPGDFFFEFDMTHWNLTKTEEFAGSSHYITMEVYER